MNIPTNALPCNRVEPKRTPLFAPILNFERGDPTQVSFKRISAGLSGSKEQEDWENSARELARYLWNNAPVSYVDALLDEFNELDILPG